MILVNDFDDDLCTVALDKVQLQVFRVHLLGRKEAHSSDTYIAAECLVTLSHTAEIVIQRLDVDDLQDLLTHRDALFGRIGRFDVPKNIADHLQRFFWVRQ